VSADGVVTETSIRVEGEGSGCFATMVLG